MADKPKGKGKAAAVEYEGKRTLYKIEGAKLVRARKACPKCGPGIMMAVHKDRIHCGSCGFTEWNKKA